MDINRETSFAAPTERVFAMLTDEGYLRERGAAAHATSVSAAVQRAGDTARTVCGRTWPADVPDFVKRFIGPQIHITETVDWAPPAPDGGRAGALTIDAGHAPITVSGSYRIVPDGPAASRLVLAATLRSTVPIVGRKIEDAAAPAIVSALDKDEEVGRQWLAAHR